MVRKYPIKLVPVTKSTIWGGDHLKKMYGKEAPFDTLGETWELTVRGDGMNMIANGEYEGKALGDYINDVGEYAIAHGFSGDRFPLLIKFLDANDKLSIQVHPDDDYALKNEGELGKTEMWYILAADDGAQIVYGLKEGVTSAQFADAVKSGHTEEFLNYVTVHEGDVFFIPSGQVHALGKGIVVAEIQQNSNVTYRVYDYCRKQADGSLRELHTEKAADAVKVRSADEINAIRFGKAKDNRAPELLAECEYFKVSKHDILSSMRLTATDESFISILCLNGNGKIAFGDEEYRISAGDSYFIPAGMGGFELAGELSVMISSIK